MSRYRIEVRVTPRRGLLDPEGKAVHHALQSLGWTGAEEVRVGKLIHLDLDAASEDEALETARAMCRRLLANPVTEDFDVRRGEGEDAAAEAGGGA